MIDEEQETECACEYCGDNPIDRVVQMRDVTPTDRGDWIQTYMMSLCKICADQFESRLYL